MTPSEIIDTQISIIRQVMFNNYYRAQAKNDDKDEKKRIDGENNGAAFDASTGDGYFHVDVMGTMYEGRSERIEALHEGDDVLIVHDVNNEHNHDNLAVLNQAGESIGNFPWQLSGTLTWALDDHVMTITSSKISYLLKKSEKYRGKKADLYVDFRYHFNTAKIKPNKTCCLVSYGVGPKSSGIKKIEVRTVDMPVDKALLLFELYYRYINDYVPKTDAPFEPTGIDGWEEELTLARKQRRANMLPDVDYKKIREKDPSIFSWFADKAITKGGARYRGMRKYLRRSFALSLYGRTVALKRYTWFNNKRVDEMDYNDLTIKGVDEWHEIVQLYPSEKDIPFDFEGGADTVLGAGKFLELADISTMTIPCGLSLPEDKIP